MSKIKAAIEDYTTDARLVDERGPTTERMQKTGGEFHLSKTGSITIRQTPIERAMARGTITDHQARAAEKLYMHWYHGGMVPAVRSPDYNIVFGNFAIGRDYESEKQQTHRKIYRIGLEAVRIGVDDAWGAGSRMPDLPRSTFCGSEAVGVLQSIVLDEQAFYVAAARHGRSNEKWAVHLLCAALNILGKQWGIS